MKKKRFVFLCAIIVALLITYFVIIRNTDPRVGESCSPVGDETVCTRFRCETGTPQPTIGGAGACSDGSKTTFIKTWGM